MLIPFIFNYSGDDVDIDPLASTKDGEVDGTNKVNKKDDDL